MDETEELAIAMAIEENRERMRRQRRPDRSGWIDGHTGVVVPLEPPVMSDPTVPRD